MKRPRRSRIQLVAAVAAVAMIATACGGGDDTSADDAEGDDPAAEETDDAAEETDDAAEETDDAAEEGSEEASAEPANVAYLAPVPPGLNYFPPFVAEALGFMEDENITFDHETVGDGVSPTTLLVQGEVDAASGGTGEIFQGLQAGQDFDIVYEYSKIAIEYVGVPEESDIQSMEDVEGTVVGIAEDELRSLLELSLQEVGLTSDDVEIVVVGTSGPTVARSFEAGDIDVFVGSILDFAAMRAAGIPMRDITPEPLTNVPATSFFATPDMIAERDVLVRFFRAWSMGYHAGLAVPEVTEAVIREVSPQTWENEEEGDALFEQVMAARSANQNMDEYGGLRTDLWENAVANAVASGDLEEALDTADFLDASMIEEINDFDRAEVEARAEEWLAEQ